jgi:hypothetical protein
MWWSGAVLGLALLVFGVAGLFTPPAAARQPAQTAGALTPTPGVCTADWQIVSSPNPTSADSVLEGLAAISASDVWAVGWYDGGVYTPRTMTQHWDGSAWSIVPSPSPGGEDVLHAVDAVASNDVWAVGYTDLGMLNPLALHWDGTAWTSIPVPRDPNSFSNELKGVAAVSASDVWAVGEYYAGTDGTDLRPLIVHWDGLAWSIVAGPPGVFSYLWAATAISANDVWAVGFGLSGTTALHWDGASWTRVALPTSPNGYVLYSVSGAAANDVWAVGSLGPLTGNGTLALHWDGMAWSIVASPNPGTNNFFDAVTAVRPGEAWAVGATGPANQGGALIEHWDGTAWSVVPNPNAAGDPGLAAVAAVGPNDVWAAGLYNSVNGTRQTLTEHYLNSCPSPTPSATPTGPTATPTATPNGRTPSATPTRPAGRLDAHLCLSLRQDPDTAVPPGGIVTYTFALVNQGPGEGDAASVHLPLDANLEVLDAHTSNPRIYVDWVDDAAVAVRFHDLGVGAGGTVQIVARVRPNAAPGTTITSRGEAVWYDRTGPHQHRHSNSVTLRVGALADGGLHGLRQALAVAPADAVSAGTGLTLSGGFYADAEPVSIWLNQPDGSVTSVTERARSDESGSVSVPLDTDGLAAGAYTLVAHGWCSGVEGVGAFTVR